MKQFFTSIILIVVTTFVLNAQKMSYSQKLVQNTRMFEISCSYGTPYGGGCIIGFDGSFGGLWFGTGIGYSTGGKDAEYVYTESLKTVSVEGYYRSDGTYVHSYKRAKPGQGGGSYVNINEESISQYYVGYWLPFYYGRILDISAAPVVGYTLFEKQKETNTKTTYGIGIRMCWSFMGLTIKATNTDISFGFMARISGWRN